MPARLDICLQRNEDWMRRLVISDDKGVAIDLTDMTLAMQVRDRLAQTLIATATIEIVNAEAGEVHVLLKGSEDTPLGEYGAAIQQAELFYDMRLTDSEDVHVVLFGGRILMSRGETYA